MKNFEKELKRMYVNLGISTGPSSEDLYDITKIKSANRAIERLFIDKSESRIIEACQEVSK